MYGGGVGVVSRYNMTLMVNQSCYHALPTVLSMAHSTMSARGSNFRVTSHPLPILPNEDRTKDTQQLGQFLLTVRATALHNLLIT